jgi:hypothetical protein
MAIIFKHFEIGNYLWAYLFYLFNPFFEKTKKMSLMAANGSFFSQTASKWHPVEDMVVKIKQE